ncbi:MAG TPA: hypothetical protein G4O15_12110 [Dehalococcoidia bacterium]|nr:hypothetical protein [Dehalococcoidia bacterium]
MWTEIKKTKNLMIAETWKELFEGEGIPILILPAEDKPMGTLLAAYHVYVPEDKKHVVEEILRKL